MCAVGLHPVPVADVPREPAREADVGVPAVRPERRRPHHQERALRHRLRRIRPPRTTLLKREGPQGARRQDFRREYTILLWVTRASIFMSSEVLFSSTEIRIMI